MPFTSDWPGRTSLTVVGANYLTPVISMEDKMKKSEQYIRRYKKAKTGSKELGPLTDPTSP